MTSATPRPRVLVVDDETQMLSIMAFALETQGLDTVTARSAEQAWKLISEATFDLLVLDVMLPGRSGVELTRKVRTVSDVPILMVTARNDEDDRLTGLLAGADDYLSKPFSPRELALRAQAIVRRSQRSRPTSRAINGPLEIDAQQRTARLRGRPLRLSGIEFGLLLVLIRHVGKVVTYRDLLSEVWFTAETQGGRDMIKTTVYRLRQRLGADGDDLVLSVRGSGYLMPVFNDET